MTLVGRFLVARKRAMTTMVPSDTRIFDMLSYRAFKHTQILVRSFSYTKLQHLILFLYWLVLEQKDTGRAAEFIHLVKLVHWFNFCTFTV